MLRSLSSSWLLRSLRSSSSSFIFWCLDSRSPTWSRWSSTHWSCSTSLSVSTRSVKRCKVRDVSQLSSHTKLKWKLFSLKNKFWKQIKAKQIRIFGFHFLSFSFQLNLSSLVYKFHFLRNLRSKFSNFHLLFPKSAMTFPTVKKCLCCIDLRTGGVIIGWLSIIASVFGFVGNIFAFIRDVELYKNDTRMLISKNISAMDWMNVKSFHSHRNSQRGSRWILLSDLHCCHATHLRSRR